MKALIALCRPQQYVKNAFVLLPLFFSGGLLQPSNLWPSLLALLSFCAAASAVYIFNDLQDIQVDRQHPRKQHRPLASGAVSARSAVLLSIVLTLLAFGLCMFQPARWAVAGVIGAYLLSNLAYSLRLKHVPILDVNVVASGFVLRLLAGSLASAVPLSPWIISMTFLLALFLALAKRRDDVLLKTETGVSLRKSVDGYNESFIDHSMTLLAGVLIVAYLMYCTTPAVIAKWQSEQLYITGLFVVIGVLRYLQISFVERDTGDPTRLLLRDRFLQIVLLGWVAGFAWIIY